MTIIFKDKNKAPLKIIRILAESTLATQVELTTNQIIFVQNAQIESIVN